MFKLWNYLFGWDYVAWSNSAADGVARVHPSGGGNPYYWRYKSTRVCDNIHKPEQVIWLTCKPSKYMGESS